MYSLWGLCMLHLSLPLPFVLHCSRESCPWQSLFLVIGYIKFSLPDVLQIHCSAPLLTVEVFSVWKQKNAMGKWNRMLKSSSPASACSVGWFPSLPFKLPRCCAKHLTGLVSQDTHRRLNLYSCMESVLISPVVHLNTPGNLTSGDKHTSDSCSWGIGPKEFFYWIVFFSH